MVPSHKPEIDVIIKTGTQTVYSPFFTSSLTHYAPIKVLCEQHGLALVVARHLQYAGPDLCLALEIGDSSRLMRYESGLAASPFARSATRNTSHLLCPELGVASQPVGIPDFRNRMWLADWQPTHGPRIYSTTHESYPTCSKWRVTTDRRLWSLYCSTLTKCCWKGLTKCIASLRLCYPFFYCKCSKGSRKNRAPLRVRRVWNNYAYFKLSHWFSMVCHANILFILS